MASKRAARGKAKARAPIDDATRILGDEEEDEEQQPCNLGDDGDDGPVVFFCGKCNLLVGDSLSWAGSDDESQIQLTRVTDNILIGEEKHVYEPRQGLRCLVVDLCCNGCQTVLGMMYLSTPKALDYKRQTFSFHVQHLESYVLGSAGQEAAAESPLEQPLTVEDRGSVEQQLLKMKSLVVSMAHRLEEVEQGGRRQVDLDESEP